MTEYLRPRRREASLREFSVDFTGQQEGHRVGGITKTMALR